MTQTRPPEKKAPKKSAAARERLATWIASRGLKATRQREVIVDAFFAQAGHLSVDELLHKAKERDPTIGAATVYRTMKILTDAGLASARHFEGGQTRYEAALMVHKVELEYGLTDHWDLALYHVFAQEAGAFKFDSWRAETRYRFAEKGEWPVDLLLYFEVERPADFAEPWEVEEKIILE